MLLQPLLGSQSCLGYNQGKKDDGLAQTVQEEASLSPAATRALLDSSWTPSWQCARQSQRFDNDPAAGGEEDCNHTRAALLGRSRRRVRKGRDLAEGIPTLLMNAVCSRTYLLVYEVMWLSMAKEDDAGRY